MAVTCNCQQFVTSGSLFSLQTITTSSSRVGACVRHCPYKSSSPLPHVSPPPPACLSAEFLDRKELLNAANQVRGRTSRAGDAGRPSIAAPVFSLRSATT